jgi:hypothetical protein
MFLYRVYRTFFLFCLIVGSFDAEGWQFKFWSDLPDRTQVIRMTQNGVPLHEPERMPRYFELQCRGYLSDILEIRFRNVPIGRILIGDHSGRWSHCIPAVQVLDDNFSISCDNDSGEMEPYMILVRMNTNFFIWAFRRVARRFTRGQ